MVGERDSDSLHEYREPRILKHFFIPEQVRDWLINECYNHENLHRRKMWRRALDSSAKNWLDRMAQSAFDHDGTMYMVIDGDPRTGKTVIATTFQIEYYEKLSNKYDGTVQCDRVRTYSALNNSIASGEEHKRIMVIEKDENDKQLGPDELIQKTAAMTTLNGSQKKHHVVISCGLKPDDMMKDAMSARVTALGYNEELHLNLGLVWGYKGRKPKGLIIKKMRLDHKDVYEEQYQWTMQQQGEVNAAGGMVSAQDEESYKRIIEKIFSKTVELWPKQTKLTRGHYLTKGQFERAIRESHQVVQTGSPRAGVQQEVQELYDKYIEKDVLPYLEQVNDKEAKENIRDVRRKAYHKSKEWENECAQSYGPYLFDNYQACTGTGEIDAQGIDKKDHMKTIIALENGTYPDSTQTTIYMGVKHGKEGGRIYREITEARMLRKLGEDVKLVLLYKEESRNKVYMVPIDLDKPRSHTIHFDTDPFIHLSSSP